MYRKNAAGRKEASRSQNGKSEHQKTSDSAGIIGRMITSPLSILKLLSPADAMETPCVIPININAEAATCCPLSPV